MHVMCLKRTDDIGHRPSDCRGIKRHWVHPVNHLIQSPEKDAIEDGDTEISDVFPHHSTNVIICGFQAFRGSFRAILWVF